MSNWYMAPNFYKFILNQVCIVSLFLWYLMYIMYICIQSVYVYTRIRDLKQQWLLTCLKVIFHSHQINDYLDLFRFIDKVFYTVVLKLWSVFYRRCWMIIIMIIQLMQNKANGYLMLRRYKKNFKMIKILCYKGERQV